MKKLLLTLFFCFYQIFMPFIPLNYGAFQRNVEASVVRKISLAQAKIQVLQKQDVATVVK